MQEIIQYIADSFFKPFVELLGIHNVTLIILVLLLVFGFLKWRSSKNKVNSYDKLIEEKDIALQRISKENREYKILIYNKLHGYTLEEAENLISKNKFSTPGEARKKLENED